MIQFWKLSSPFVQHGHIRILIPILILWFAWRMRNDVKFNNIRFSAQRIIRNVCAYLSRLHKAQGMKAKNWKGDLLVAAKMGFFFPKTTPQSPKVIRWRYPIEGWWKLNTDGASKGNPGCAGAGGIIRDCHGRFILEFPDGLGVQTNTYAALYAIVRGLQLTKNAGCTHLEVESDAKVVLQLIHNNAGDWKVQHLLTRLQILCRDMNVIFSHAYREENQPADFPANQACHQNANDMLLRAEGRLASLIRLDKLLSNFRF
ncbi:UNVERIFIED_CONTAM: putative ribonuclease H protein [Sesamum latifolium]|uniref:Ribonuclease H protein n=1 Tax=Sesamum latifolium TaxID=2727402 RepID=A0AAW2X5N8_9LAMI